MARVTPPLARAIDRLARRAHRFHRFAHHPLCAEYAGELVRLGRRDRVCRGCSYAVLGAAFGVVTGSTLAFAWLAAGIAATALYGAVATHAKVDRASKLWTRLLPAAALMFLFCAGLRSSSMLGAAVALAAACTAALLLTAYRRRGPDRTPCTVCAERSQPQPCRGFAPIVRRERALQRVARRWLMAAGCG